MEVGKFGDSRISKNFKNLDELMKLNVLKCVQCRLCSYVCPSRVEMTETVGKAKDLVIKMKK